MRRRARHGAGRVSPAFVVAVLALVAAVAGVALATPIAERALTKKKVAKIADKEIKRLAPHLTVANAANAGNAASAANAANATNATNATNADKVNGVELRRFNYHAPSGVDSGPTQIFSGGGLTLTASCRNVGQTHVIATTSVPNSYLGSDAFDVGSPNANLDNVEKAPFNPGDSVEVLDPFSAGLVGSTGYYNPNSNVQLHWTASRVDGPCDFVGYAVIG